MKRKRYLLLFLILIVISVIAFFFIFLQTRNRQISPLQTEKNEQKATFLLNSPEDVTQIYYNSYALCLKQHPGDLQNAHNLQKDCPMNKFDGLSNNFDKKNELSNLSYTDQVLCDEGIPMKMVIGKAYIGTDQTATVDVTTLFKDHHYTIPVLLRKEKGFWKIFKIECDLDGHID